MPDVLDIERNLFPFVAAGDRAETTNGGIGSHAQPMVYGGFDRFLVKQIHPALNVPVTPIIIPVGTPDENPTSLSGLLTGPIIAGHGQSQIIGGLIAPAAVSFGESKTVASYNADQEAFFKVNTIPAANSKGFELWLRISGETGYSFYYEKGTGFQMYQHDVGGGSPLLAGTANPFPILAGDYMWFRAIGTVLTAYVAHAGGEFLPVLTGDGSVYNNAGAIGLNVLNDASTRLQDFGGGSLLTVTFISDTDAGTFSDAFILTASLSDTDAGAGSEAQTLAAVLSASDAATGSDSSALIAVLNGTEPATGTDAVATLIAALSSTDISTGSEVASLLVRMTIAETATGSDTSVLAVLIARTETATGTDVGTLVTAISGSDALAGTEASSLHAVIVNTDVSSGSDTSVLVTVLNGTDSGAGSDTGVLIVGVTANDVVVGTDGSQLVAVLPAQVDNATGIETVVLQTVLSGQDAGSLVDSGGLQALLSDFELLVGLDTVLDLAAALTALESLTGIETESLAAIFSDVDSGSFTEHGVAITGTLLLGFHTYLLSSKIGTGKISTDLIEPGSVTMNPPYKPGLEEAGFDGGRLLSADEED